MWNSSIVIILFFVFININSKAQGVNSATTCSTEQSDFYWEFDVQNNGHKRLAMCGIPA